MITKKSFQMLIQRVLSIVELIQPSMKSDGRSQQKIQNQNKLNGMIQIGKMTKLAMSIQIGIDLLLRHLLPLIIHRNCLLFLITISRMILNFSRLPQLLASKRSKQLIKSLQDCYTQIRRKNTKHSLKKSKMKNLNMYLMHMKP